MADWMEMGKVEIITKIGHNTGTVPVRNIQGISMDGIWDSIGGGS
jgi:hypothetical protein